MLSLDRRRSRAPSSSPLSLVLLLLLLALLSCCGGGAANRDGQHEADKQHEAGAGAVPPVLPLAGGGPIDGGGAASGGRHKSAGGSSARSNSAASDARAAREAAREAARAFATGATRTAGDAAVRISGEFFFPMLSLFLSKAPWGEGHSRFASSNVSPSRLLGLKFASRQRSEKVLSRVEASEEQSVRVKRRKRGGGTGRSTGEREADCSARRR